MLVQSALTAARTVAAGGRASVEQLIAWLLDYLPLECRTAISFSTGLRYSSRRPFRVLPLPSDPASRRWLARQPNVTVLDLTERIVASTASKAENPGSKTRSGHKPASG
jgi:hypothetical protein